MVKDPFNIQLSGPVGHRNKILRTINEIKKKELEEDIPDEFLCPITREVMSDPVIAAGQCITSASDMISSHS